MVICFDDYQSPPIPIDNGLDQGCNLSTFLYRFYNGDQISRSVERKDELATNFADDAMLAVAGADNKDATRKLEVAFHREGGPSQWAETHFSTYEYHKFAFMTLPQKKITDLENLRKKKKREPAKIKLDGTWITATTSHKFLGVIIDKELRFQKHTAYAIKKGTKIVNQIRRLSKNATGLKELARRIYYTTISTSMLYAVDIWCPPQPRIHGKKPRGIGGVVIKKLKTVQRRAAIQATRALCTTPFNLFFAHADMTPMNKQIQHMCNGAALQLALLPVIHPLGKEIKQAAIRRPKKHPS